jgi:hypothetical protein
VLDLYAEQPDPKPAQLYATVSISAVIALQLLKLSTCAERQAT